jgi:hypothetical protein
MQPISCNSDCNARKTKEKTRKIQCPEVCRFNCLSLRKTKQIIDVANMVLRLDLRLIEKLKEIAINRLTNCNQSLSKQHSAEKL